MSLVLWTVKAGCGHCEWGDTVQRLDKAEAMNAASVLMVAHHDMEHPECDVHDGFDFIDHGVIG